MSNGTKSDYTKTGKKVMCINSNRRDLTYKKVYDIFTTKDSVDFIINDDGDKRYERLEFPHWCEKSDGMVDKANETKLKFKVGDKVKVVNIPQGYSSDMIPLGSVGEIIDITGLSLPYEVKSDTFSICDSWYFRENDIELVEEPSVEQTSADNTTNETKHKFSVGDTVRVTSTDYIRQYYDSIKVGDVGVITKINDNSVDPYKVKFDDYDVSDNWWFTDKCIELVNDDVGNASIKTGCGQIVSDGGSSSYYAQQIPKGTLERFNATGIIEAKDVIRLFLGNDFNMGNIFKAYCRIISLRNGKGKAGIDEQYDLTKVKYFAEDELNHYLENKDV